MTKIISITNHKGGVGKSTTTSCIGTLLARNGKKTLLVDLDAQANLSKFFFNDQDFDNIESSIYESLVDETFKTPLPILHVREGLDLVPSSLSLAQIDLRLAGRYTRETILRRLLQPIAEDYDYILLDCPPSLGILVVNAMVAATDIYIVTTAETMPYKGISIIEDTADLVRNINKDLSLSGIIITMWGNSKLFKVVEQSLRTKYGDIVFKTKIRRAVAVPESQATNLGLMDYAPESTAAKDYISLTEEILGRE